MSVDELESLESLQRMCQRSNKPPQECPMDCEDSTTPDLDTAQVFDLNNRLYLALQIEDQVKYNQSEFLG